MLHFKLNLSFSKFNQQTTCTPARTIFFFPKGKKEAPCNFRCSNIFWNGVCLTFYFILYPMLINIKDVTACAGYTVYIYVYSMLIVKDSSSIKFIHFYVLLFM